RRLDLLVKEGLVIQTGTTIGKDITGKELLDNFDALCIAIGAGYPRSLPVEGSEFEGIYYALDFLTSQNKVNSGQLSVSNNPISAEGKRVLVIGGGDTGSDCVGTSIRQKAVSVTQIEILPKPPLNRTPDNPWPYYAKVLKTSTSHEEGCERLWNLSTLRFVGDGRITRGAEVEEVSWEYSDNKYIMKPVPETRRVIETDLVLLALGFVHPVLEGLVTELGFELDARNNVKVDNHQVTSLKKVFAAGDTVNGTSLVVNAIASGRRAAKYIDKYLRSME
ncbi:MAG: FAD-dependent oxidoreductase, partial [Bacteroidales bacterium]